MKDNIIVFEEIKDKVILFDGVNKKAYDLTEPAKELTSVTGTNNLMSSLEAMKNRMAFNVMQMEFVEDDCSSYFFTDVANDLLSMNILKVEPSDTLYELILNRTD